MPESLLNRQEKDAEKSRNQKLKLASQHNQDKRQKDLHH